MMMKREKTVNFIEHDEMLTTSELMEINGGEDGTVAYYAGYSHVFTVAHLLTFGMSTLYYLTKKATS